MSTIMARRVVASPVRDATATWAKIIDILAPDSASPARTELTKAAGIACSSIASEATKNAAIVVWGGGPRARVYCLFDEEAITADDANEDTLAVSPTTGDWKLSLPCLPEDVAWSQKKLSEVSGRITARSMDDDVVDDPGTMAATAPLAINVEEFLKS